MKVRRVVTGHSADGKAKLASDTEVDALTVSLLPGMEFHRLWGADAAPTFPDDGSPYPSVTYFPLLGGFRFGLFTLPPDGTAAAAPIDVEVALKEAEEKLPGAIAHLEPDQSGMHTTDTIDFEYVVSGESGWNWTMVSKCIFGQATRWCKTERGTLGATRVLSRAKWWSALLEPTVNEA